LISGRSEGDLFRQLDRQRGRWCRSKHSSQTTDGALQRVRMPQ